AAQALARDRGLGGLGGGGPEPALGRWGRAAAARAQHRRGARRRDRLGRGGAARPRGRLRRARNPWRAWLPHPPVPLADGEPADRRLWRLGDEPHALCHRGGRGGARRVAAGEAALPQAFGRGRRRLGTGREREARAPRQAQGGRCHRLQLRRHAGPPGGERRPRRLRLSGALCRAAAQRGRHPQHGGGAHRPCRSGRAHPRGRPRRPHRAGARDPLQPELADGCGAEARHRHALRAGAAALQLLALEARRQRQGHDAVHIYPRPRRRLEIAKPPRHMALETIYTVFVSSTYEDLRIERAEVQRALLKLHCLPIGMELFPSADEETWEFIKRQIQNADYYVVVLAGRYGSITADGLSWTEKEYDYAREI